MAIPNQLLRGASIVRLSRGTFDPARFSEMDEANARVGEYLVPAISALVGVQAYFAGVSPSGSMINVSLWDSNEHADQMSRLPEMVVRARQDFEGLGV
ncbi:MAG: hypothetical protein JOZ81_29440, partial [Chloroflexi bacterium]|nr:hypothetical protein [Chloroflexota bacterium]